LPRLLGDIASPFKARKTVKRRKNLLGLAQRIFSFKGNIFYALHQSLDPLCLVNKKSGTSFD